MDNFTLIAILVVVASMIAVSGFTRRSSSKVESRKASYFYGRRESIMSEYEASFYRRLQGIVQDRYIILPQIRLSSLVYSKTYGRYKKSSLSRINQKSIDYVLADPQTLRTVYAIELDDSSHDNPRRKDRDNMVATTLGQVGIPLVRFRNPERMSDEDIIGRFQEVNERIST